MNPFKRLFFTLIDLETFLKMKIRLWNFEIYNLMELFLNILYMKSITG